ncbi:flavin reductase family protein [bacterium]|nr:flavin reductase family protein [bacterium]
MEIPADSVSMREAYGLLISCIVPRPVAWVSTRSADGVANLAPFSFFMGVGSKPPMLAVSVGHRHGSSKDTARNIRETGEFVVNICTRSLADRMVATSAEVGPEIDEFQLAGLTPIDSLAIQAPGVAESPIRMECRLHSIVDPAPNPVDLVLGEVIHFHLDDSILTDSLPDPMKLDPVARLGGSLYASLGEIFPIGRPDGG